MQEKVAFDTNIYIGIFNHGRYAGEVDGFTKVMYLVHPVLHELWMGARGEPEIRHLLRFSRRFIQLQRLVIPQPSTQLRIAQVCQRLRVRGMLDPVHPRVYNDICIALLARQIGATVVTADTNDFERIRQVADFNYRAPIRSSP